MNKRSNAILSYSIVGLIVLLAVATYTYQHDLERLVHEAIDPVPSDDDEDE